MDAIRQPLSHRAAGPQGGLMNRAVGTEAYAAEKNSNSSFTFAVTNAGATEKRIVLFPGLLSTLAKLNAATGIDADCIAIDGVSLEEGGNAIITVSSRRSLELFQEYVKRNPTRISSIQLQVSNQQQLSKPFTITGISPYKGAGNEEFIPQTTQKTSDSNTNLANISFKHFQLDDQKVLDFVLIAGATIQITMFTSVERNAAYTLQAEAVAALGE